MKNFYSHGTLLLTAEYAVLDGAKALAVPTQFGQKMQVITLNEPLLKWESRDENGEIWFNAEFILNQKSILLKQGQKDQPVAERLLQILQTAAKLNPNFVEGNPGYYIRNQLEFNRNWGLGSSSTLINNIASWLEINPYTLLDKTFGGSGYDIAAAREDSAFTFQLTSGEPSVLNSAFDPIFKEQLFFVYLNQKQNSRQAIAHYRNQDKENLADLINKISGLTERIILCDNLPEFQLLIDLHETLISKAINLPKIKSQLFSDYPGSIKSLGGWGGDFILATGGEEEKEYFRRKNYKTILSFTEMVL